MQGSTFTLSSLSPSYHLPSSSCPFSPLPSPFPSFCLLPRFLLSLFNFFPAFLSSLLFPPSSSLFLFLSPPTLLSSTSLSSIPCLSLVINLPPFHYHLPFPPFLHRLSPQFDFDALTSTFHPTKKRDSISILRRGVLFCLHLLTSLGKDRITLRGVLFSISTLKPNKEKA